MISTIAGTGLTGYNGDDIVATSASLNYPVSLNVNPIGDILIADTIGNRIRLVSASTGRITTEAGTGLTGFNGDNIDASLASIWAPQGVCVMANGNIIIADTNNVRVRMVNTINGKISTIAGTGSAVRMLQIQQSLYIIFNMCMLYFI